MIKGLVPTMLVGALGGFLAEALRILPAFRQGNGPTRREYGVSLAYVAIGACAALYGWDKERMAIDVAVIGAAFPSLFAAGLRAVATPPGPPGEAAVSPEVLEMQGEIMELRRQRREQVQKEERPSRQQWLHKGGEQLSSGESLLPREQMRELLRRRDELSRITDELQRRAAQHDKSDQPSEEHSPDGGDQPRQAREPDGEESRQASEPDGDPRHGRERPLHQPDGADTQYRAPPPPARMQPGGWAYEDREAPAVPDKTPDLAVRHSAPASPPQRSPRSLKDYAASRF